MSYLVNSKQAYNKLLHFALRGLAAYHAPMCKALVLIEEVRFMSDRVRNKFELIA